MIEQIIDEELIDIYFQPIVSIRTKSIYAFESLTRCKYNNQNIPPNLLFNLAKEKDLSIKLDEITRIKAIRKFQKYYQKNNELILFLNFESTLINRFNSNYINNSFIETIIELNIPFKNFVLEIKEDEIINVKALKEFCTVYKELGFSIALDDFGTGNSNFDRIDLIRPNIIKVDKSLFVNMRTNLVNKEVVKAIAKMSHNLGIRVLAEGVEDEDSICISLKSTINLFQGYYFSKALCEIKETDSKFIVQKSIDIGKQFKQRTINAINRKREFICDYETIANNLIKKLDSFENANTILKKEFIKLEDIEAIYLIDCESSKQINDTIINENVNRNFRPTKNGEEHYLKEYYYITLESKQGSFLSQKYISYASGSICKTFAKKFDFDDRSFILCLDIVIEGA